MHDAFKGKSRKHIDYFYMPAINTTDQSQSYTNPAAAAVHEQAASFYMQNNGMEQQDGLSGRNPGQYQTQMNPPSYNYSPIPNGFQQQFYLPQGYPQNQFMPSTNPRPMNPSQIPIIRPANETMNNYPHFIPQNGCPPPQYTPGNNSLPSAPSVYSGQFYQTHQTPTGYAQQPVQTQMANQLQISQQQQQQAYIANLQTATKVHPTQPTQHAPIDQPSASAPTSQPQIPLNVQQSSSYVAPPAVAAAVVSKKGKKCPLVIINPDLHNPITLSPQSVSTSAINVSNKIQMQTEFRKQFAQILGVSSNVIIDKPADRITTVRDKTSVDTSKSQPITPLPVTTSFGGITSQQTLTLTPTNNEKSTSPNHRLRYDRHELLRIRDSSGPFPTPKNLPDLDIVITRRDDNAAKSNHVGEKQTVCTNPSSHQQSLSNNHTSSAANMNSANAANDSKRETEIDLSAKSGSCNRVDQSKVDANNKFLHDVKAILKKLTSKTYQKTQKKLEALEIDRYERLEGMVTIFFSKAIDDSTFSLLYAKLCKQFQKKQVTVPGDDGKLVTYYFRQILLTRCQKEFESDYRQEIEYEKRKAEVDSLTDDKKRKEEGDKLEDDLVKTKRRKLGNIVFIGELFKLQMLTDIVMYDCIEYLLRDKSDEENIECLCCLLRTIGKELDDKALEKIAKKNNLEKYYGELNIIVKEQKISPNICCMIQDLIDLRHLSIESVALLEFSNLYYFDVSL
ncbi:unnamed protein product [Rotaria socialis]